MLGPQSNNNRCVWPHRGVGSLFPVSMCVYGAHVCVCGHTSASAGAHACEDLRLMKETVLIALPSHSLRQGLSVKSRAYPGSADPVSPLFLSWSYWQTTISQLLWFWGLELCSSLLPFTSEPSPWPINGSSSLWSSGGSESMSYVYFSMPATVSHLSPARSGLGLLSSD